MDEGRRGRERTNRMLNDDAGRHPCKLTGLSREMMDRRPCRSAAVRAEGNRVAVMWRYGGDRFSNPPPPKMGTPKKPDFPLSY
jgi:hypothetical protein